MLLDYILVPSLLALIAAVGMHDAVPIIPVQSWIGLFMALTLGINLLGIRMNARVTACFLVGELLVLVTYLAVGGWALAHGRGRGLRVDALRDALYNPGTVSIGLVLGAVSFAMLSFLGFDGISMLAEENRGGAQQIGTAMRAALLLTGALFIAQTWMATLFVPAPTRLIADGDPAGTAFYDTARVAGGPWLATLTAVATAPSWGIANSLVAPVGNVCDANYTMLAAIPKVYLRDPAVYGGTHQRLRATAYRDRRRELSPRGGVASGPMLPLRHVTLPVARTGRFAGRAGDA
jgi:amino acid transporter